MKKNNFFLLLFCVLYFSFGKSNAAIKSVVVNATNFDPSYFYINVGDIIVWNLGAGGGYHTTTSTLIPNGALSWNGFVNPMQNTFSYTVTVGGDYDYICSTDTAMAVVGHFTVFATATGFNDRLPSLSFVHYSFSERSITIKYFLSSSELIYLRLFDLIGKTVLTIDPIQSMEGAHQQKFSVATLPKGLYIIELKGGEFLGTRKIIIE